MKNTAIFIDLENVYYGLKKYHMDPDHPEENHNLFLRLQEHYGKDSIRMIEAYADFEQIEVSMVSLQRKEFMFTKCMEMGKMVEIEKMLPLIQLCLDAMGNIISKPGIQNFVIVSADQDMIPFLDRLVGNGQTCRAILFF